MRIRLRMFLTAGVYCSWRATSTEKKRVRFVTRGSMPIVTYIYHRTVKIDRELLTTTEAKQ
jgi:hypothetical protein